MAGNPQEASEIFADYFESVYSDFQFVQPEAKNYYGFEIDTLFVSYEDVYKRLCDLKDDFSSGPDDIPPILLKNCTFPLTTIFNISLQSGVHPTSWKTSFAVLIHKSGEKSKAKNYRPICNNSTIDNRKFSNPMFLYFFLIPCLIICNFAKERNQKKI
jgi:hypothetical protein